MLNAAKQGKVLYTATSDVHLKTFHLPYLEWLKQKGLEIHIAAEKRGDVNLLFCDRTFFLPFKRSPFHWRNLLNLVALIRIIRENKYQIIHCHTPTVSVLTRVAAFIAGDRSKVLYTAHGFHFYKGGPASLWLLYYPIEKILSAITDSIILINHEDFDLVKKKFLNKNTFLINGIGVDDERFITQPSESKLKLRAKFHLRKDDFVLLYVAEFIPRKNHQFLLECIRELKGRIPSLKVLLVGRGQLLAEMKSVANEYDIGSVIQFLGWRDDVADIAAIADVGISTSKQEGLGLGLAEEMLCSVPIVASFDRGHKEMIDHGANGFLYQQGNHRQFITFVMQFYDNEGLRQRAGKVAYEKALSFTLPKSLSQMADIYNRYLTAK